MTQKPHASGYKLIDIHEPTEQGVVNLVYGETNSGENRGLEAYYYKQGADHFYRSRRWKEGNIPIKYQAQYNRLKSQIELVEEGHKLSFAQHELR